MLRRTVASPGAKRADLADVRITQLDLDIAADQGCTILGFQIAGNDTAIEMDGHIAHLCVGIGCRINDLYFAAIHEQLHVAALGTRVTAHGNIGGDIHIIRNSQLYITGFPRITAHEDGMPGTTGNADLNVAISVRFQTTE